MFSLKIVTKYVFHLYGIETDFSMVTESTKKEYNVVCDGCYFPQMIIIQPIHVSLCRAVTGKSGKFLTGLRMMRVLPIHFIVMLVDLPTAQGTT